ncbi:MAG: hypothetical protein ACREHG_01060 [Candidatus Saccharimonadales bacterium]
MIRRIGLVLIGLLFLSISNAYADTVQCTVSMGRKAFDASDDAKSWNEYYANYKNYAACDDGAIAEGFSDSVAQLFAKHWDNIEQFIELSNKDEDFKYFALSHIDETDDYNDLQRIATNTKKACPGGQAPLCKAIWAQASYPDVMGLLSLFAHKQKTKESPQRIYYPENNDLIAGRLVNDHKDDVVVAYTLEGIRGGTDWLRYLAVYLQSDDKDDPEHRYCCSVQIGGKGVAEVDSISIKNHEILVSGKAFIEDKDAMNTPSKPMQLKFKIKDGKLIEAD